MMKKIMFTKMQGAGNDFIVIDSCRSQAVNRKLIQKLCDRKYGVGADGVLLIGKSKVADVRMRIFNADGTEAEMCGNGARCAALYASHKSQVTRHKKKIKLGTKAGIIECEVKNDGVKIKLIDPKDIKMDVSLKVCNHILKVDFLNTGVPHVVMFVEGLNKLDVVGLGRQIRHDKYFAPKGANVNFVEFLDKNSIAVRTYERGVEDETLACGTGATASALMASVKESENGRVEESESQRVKVQTKSGEILKIYFERQDNKFKNVWLEGSAKIVFKGECYV